MEITLNELLEKGLPATIKNNKYYSAEQYVSPFVERMSEFTNDFRVQVKTPDIITLDKDKEFPNMCFTRVYVQAVLPEGYDVGGSTHNNVIGMVYGLDVRKPVVKLFKGGLNSACTNLCVFNPDMLQCQELQPESAINFKFVKEIMDREDSVREILKQMESTDFDTSVENIQKQLGKWVRNTMHCSYDNGFNKVKIAASSAIDAYKLLFEDVESPYYVGINNPTNMFNVYNAFTQINTDLRKKDMFNDFEKSLLVRDIITL